MRIPRSVAVDKAESSNKDFTVTLTVDIHTTNPWASGWPGASHPSIFPSHFTPPFPPFGSHPTAAPSVHSSPSTRSRTRPVQPTHTNTMSTQSSTHAGQSSSSAHSSGLSSGSSSSHHSSTTSHHTSTTFHTSTASTTSPAVTTTVVVSPETASSNNQTMQNTDLAVILGILIPLIVLLLILLVYFAARWYRDRRLRRDRYLPMTPRGDMKPFTDTSPAIPAGWPRKIPAPMPDTAAVAALTNINQSDSSRGDVNARRVTFANDTSSNEATHGSTPHASTPHASDSQIEQERKRSDESIPENGRAGILASLSLVGPTASAVPSKTRVSPSRKSSPPKKSSMSKTPQTTPVLGALEQPAPTQRPQKPLPTRIARSRPTLDTAAPAIDSPRKRKRNLLAAAPGTGRVPFANRVSAASLAGRWTDPGYTRLEEPEEDNDNVDSRRATYGSMGSRDSAAKKPESEPEELVSAITPTSSIFKMSNRRGSTRLSTSLHPGIRNLRGYSPVSPQVRVFSRFSDDSDGLDEDDEEGDDNDNVAQDAALVHTRQSTEQQRQVSAESDPEPDQAANDNTDEDQPIYGSTRARSHASRSTRGRTTDFLETPSPFSNLDASASNISDPPRPIPGTWPEHGGTSSSEQSPDPRGAASAPATTPAVPTQSEQSAGRKQSTASSLTLAKNVLNVPLRISQAASLAMSRHTSKPSGTSSSSSGELLRQGRALSAGKAARNKRMQRRGTQRSEDIEAQTELSPTAVDDGTTTLDAGAAVPQPPTMAAPPFERRKYSSRNVGEWRNGLWRGPPRMGTE